MPVGFPKDPVAHAAVLAANRAEKARITKHGHRAYRPSGAPRKKAATEVDLLWENKNLSASDLAMIKALEADKTRLEYEVDDLARQLNDAKETTNDLRLYLFAVLDLVANQK